MPSRTRSGSSPACPSWMRPIALMIWPGVQNPHWKPSWAMKAACTGWSWSPRATPSMVRISAPSWLTASARHELIRRPSTRTVQAPHWPRSQPFLVPVRSRRSRRRSRSVTRGSSSSTSRRTPFTVMERFMQCSDDAILGIGPMPLWQPYAEAPSAFQETTATEKSMGNIAPDAARRPRVDAVRNRERLLEAAKAVFSAGGPGASLEAVARRAGVGIGTLYRHFPTREALFEAVYRREVEQLGELADSFKGAAAPAKALRRWRRSNVEFDAPQ